MQNLLTIEQGDWNQGENVAAFDLDGTLIKTKSGRKFARDYTDWVLFDDNVKTKLEELHSKKFTIVIISNQKGILKGKPCNIDQFKIKISDIAKKLGSSVPFLFLGALLDDNYRKPATGMWEELNKHKKGNINLLKSCYVGDAAGRVKDFADSDLKFAKNIGINFFTPEMFFLGGNEEKLSIDFDPLTLIENTTVQFKFEKPEKQTVVIFVGFPGSGKTSFYNFYFKPHDFVHINQDTLKTKAKCEREFKKVLNSGNNIVVDNTNPTIEKRRFFINEAKSKKANVICVHFNLSMREAQHINNYRKRKGGRNVPIVTYRVFNKRFQLPTLEEGYEKIETVKFIPNFQSEDEEKLFLQFS